MHYFKIFVALLLANRYKYTVAYVNRTQHTLSERYQLHENVRGTKVNYCISCIEPLANKALE